MYGLFWTISVRSSATPKVVPSPPPIGIERDSVSASTPSPPHTPVLENSQTKVPTTPESISDECNQKCESSIAPTFKRPYNKSNPDDVENVWKRSRRRILDAIRSWSAFSIRCRRTSMWKSFKSSQSLQSLQSLHQSRSLCNTKR